MFSIFPQVLITIPNVNSQRFLYLFTDNSVCFNIIIKWQKLVEVLKQGSSLL